MATPDTWGTSWNGSWALSWLRSYAPPIPPEPQAGGGGRGSKKRKPLVIVEVDGEEFRVPLGVLDSFLQAKRKEVKAEAKVVAKTVAVLPPAPKIEVIEVIQASEEMLAPLVMQKVVETNKAMNDIWLGTIGRQIAENARRKMRDEEDEAIIMLLGD